MNPEYVLAGLGVLATCLFGISQLWPKIESNKMKSLLVVGMIALSVVTVIFMFQEDVVDTKSREAQTTKDNRFVIQDLSFRIPKGWKRVNQSDEVSDSCYEYDIMDAVLIREGEDCLRPITIRSRKVQSIDFSAKKNPKLWKDTLYEVTKKNYSEEVLKKITKAREVVDYNLIEFHKKESNGFYNPHIFGVGATMLFYGQNGFEEYNYSFYFLEKDYAYEVNFMVNAIDTDADRFDLAMKEIVNSVRPKSFYEHKN